MLPPSALASCIVAVALLLGCGRDGTAPGAPRAHAPATPTVAASGSSPAPSVSAPSPPVTPSASTAVADDASGLQVGLRLAAMHFARIADLSVTITLRNTGGSPRRVYVRYLTAGNLSLEVDDASGARVPPLSPPVPAVDDGVTGWTTLPPGASQSYSCDAGIGVDVPSGRYRVRFAGVPGDRDAGTLRSGWIDFNVGP